MSGKRIDWMDFAHSLHKERERMQESLPAGLCCHLSLSDWGFDHAQFAVTLDHKKLNLTGYGMGSTPAKALKEAMARFKVNYEKQQRRPRIAETKALAAAGQTLFEA